MIKFKTTENIEFGKTLFLIPSYQRGYRWKNEDVKKLLKDLVTFTGSDYCLQPLELQKTTCPFELKDSGYQSYIRVVDGQQRLTTLSIIAKVLNIKLEWDIYYLTEKTTKFLSNLLSDDYKKETINAHFRHEVEETVEKFAEKDTVAKYFDGKSNIVFPIHFLPDDNGEAVEADKGQNAFNRLNAGKTPLTSSELIRALYMVHDSGLDDQNRIEISKEWELIENTLTNEQFWLMFNALGLEKTPTRIDLLFALVLESNLKVVKNNSRAIYEKLESKYYDKKINLQDVWNEVMLCFWWMQSCYEDIECFNYLCWIAMFTDNQATTIYQKHLKYPTMMEFKNVLIKIIFDNGICNIPLLYGSPRLKDFLVLCNTLECNKNKERLLFDRLVLNYDQFDIEHIDSQTKNDLENSGDREAWLESVFDEYEELRQNYSREEFRSREDIDNLVYQIEERNKGKIVENKDGLGNLVLLPSGINRSYKNTVFPSKRKILLKAIEEGKEYILPSTSKAFMKFYTEKATNITYWQKDDYDSYQNAMLTLINDFISKAVDISKKKYDDVNFSPALAFTPTITPVFTPKITRFDNLPKIHPICQGEVSFETMMSYIIRIPKIQRLYVQGRLDSFGQKCLKGFASTLVDSVCKRIPCPLDMIYGIAIDTANGNVFQPLDGQQRLTTLLLLFWLCGENDKEWKFDYESRRATEIFIQKLMKTPAPELIKPEDYEENKKKLKGKDYSPLCSNYIERQNWFMPIWKKDPGISGMLEMLDSLYDKLINAYIPEKGFNFYYLTFNINYIDVAESEYDHIFLKMNSRGRQLTTWENVKAVIDKYVPNSYQLSWKKDINLTWPERIWEKVNYDIDKLDMVLLNVTSEALKYIGYTDKADDTFQLDKWMEANHDKLNAFFSCATTLFSATEINNAKLRKAMIPSWNTEGELIPNFGEFDNECKKRLAAYYAAKKCTNNDWMRVVWNIVENSDADTNLPGAMKLIDELAEHSNSILEFLANHNKEIKSQFAKEQLEEEREKAKRIMGWRGNHGKKDEAWYCRIKEAEKYAFFHGYIRFLFCNSKNEPQWDIFEKKFSRSKELFDEGGVKNNEKISKFEVVRDFLKLCTKCEQLNNQTCLFNTDSSNWRKILTDSRWIQPVDHLLQNTPICEEKDIIASTLSHYWDDFPLDQTINYRLRVNYNGRLVFYQKYARDALIFDQPREWERNTTLLDFTNKKVILLNNPKILNCIFIYGWNIEFIYLSKHYIWFWSGEIKNIDNDEKSYSNIKLRRDFEKFLEEQSGNN